MTALILLLFVAALWDLWKGKVPNKLILFGFFLGLGRIFLSREAEQVLDCLPGVILPVLVFFPLFQIGALGAGDIKLFSLIGCFLPMKEAFSCMVVAFFVAAAYSLLRLLWKKNLVKRMQYGLSYLYLCFQSRKLLAYYPRGIEGERIRQEAGIRFSVPVLIGTVLVAGGLI